jgi:hypothetical protein
MIHRRVPRKLVRKKVRRCVLCRCTDAKACPGGCAWIDPRMDICSSCVQAIDRYLLHERMVEGME